VTSLTLLFGGFLTMSENANVVENVEVSAAQPKAKRPRRDFGVPRLEFCELWTKVNSVQEAADEVTRLARERKKIGPDDVVTKDVVSARAAVCRADGINLKKMPKNGRTASAGVSDINARIAALSAPTPAA
jgi:hypothetical protein